MRRWRMWSGDVDDADQAAVVQRWDVQDESWLTLSVQLNERRKCSGSI
jgi:hypothetical protein